MFFQISPVQRQKSADNTINAIRKRIREAEEEQTRCEVLSLAPFTANPKIVFHDVHIGVTHVRKLLIKNPNKFDVKLFIDSTIPKEINVELNWNEVEIKQGEEMILELSWCPTTEEANQYKLILSDTKRITREVAVVIKTFLPKKKMKLSQNKSINPKPKSKTLASVPIKNTKKLPSISVCRSTGNHFQENKENVNCFSNQNYSQTTQKISANSTTSTTFILSSKINFSLGQIDEITGRATYTVPNKLNEDRRETYIISNDNNKPFIDTDQNTSSLFRDSLENDPILSTPRREMFKVNPNYNSTPTLASLLENKCRETLPLRTNQLEESENFSTILTKENLLNNETKYFLETPLSIGKLSSATYVREGATFIKKEPLDENFGADHENEKYSINKSTFTLKPTSMMEMQGLHSINEEVSYFNDEPVKQTHNYFWTDSAKREQENGWAIKEKYKTTQSSSSKERTFSYNNKEKHLHPLPIEVQESFHPKELYYMKWVNSYLTPPNEFDLKIESTGTSIAVDNHIPYSYKLDLLRKRAKEFYCSKEISDVRKTINNLVDTEKISIRTDKNLHLNISLKNDFSALILCYNPVWLQIGLETIYDHIIPLRSACDKSGLENFIAENLLKNSDLLKKYKTVYAPQYICHLKRIILKKFLTLVYFLDHAKIGKLIKHDPCLFSKNSKIKDSSTVLIYFAREYLANIGNIEKVLKKHNYIVTHAQSYLHEFDYSISNIYVDLRDGVCLAKLMELLQIRDDLMEKLRVPAISRLQKIHNIEVVLQSLKDYGFTLQCDIESKDLVDGDRLKTFTFLSEIIDQFQLQFMTNSATIIQRWYRSFPIKMRRRQLNKRWEAARKIQNWYRHLKMARFYSNLVIFVKQFIEERRRNLMATKIQCYFRMIVQRKKYLHQRQLIVRFQACCRGWYIRTYYKKNRAAIIIQTSIRRYVARKHYLQLKSVSILIQQRFRMNLLMQATRKSYLLKKKSCETIQTFYRMCIARRRFVILKNACILIQQRFRANQLMKKQYSEFKILKHNVIFIQQKWRAKKLGEKVRQDLVEMRRSVNTIERYYLDRKQRMEYLNKKRCAIIIQQWYRSITAMRKCKNNFVLMKRTVLKLEQVFIAKKIRKEYLELKKTTITIQSKFRAIKAGRVDYINFQRKKNAALVIQRKFQAQQKMLQVQKEYQQLKNAVLIVQRRFRANIEMRKQRKYYLQLKTAVIIMQQHYRAIIIGKEVYEYYQKLRNSTIYLQRKFRARQLMLKHKTEYNKLKSVTIIIQQRYRANVLYKKDRVYYETLKKITVKIQLFFRSRQLMIKQRNEFIALRKAAITIQKQYKMKLARKRYLELKSAAVALQTRFRANKLRLEAVNHYTALRKATLIIQRYFRNRQEMIKQRNDFNALRKAAIIIQKQYKMKLARKRYLELKSAAVAIQARFRANKLRIEAVNNYTNLRKAAVIIQTKFKANLAVKKAMKDYMVKRNTIINFQKYLKGYLARKKYTGNAAQLIKLENLKNQAATKIQARWRGYLIRKSNNPIITALKTKKQTLLATGKLLNPKTLGERCNIAMSSILNERASYVTLIRALEDFDFITRHSPDLCDRMSHILPNQLYVILTSAARSRPEMESCNFCALILINFYKYERTRSSSWNPDYLDLLLNVLTNWCDKEAPLFCTLATLLWLFAHDNDWKQIILNKPNLSQRLQKIHLLVTRKQGMIMKSMKNPPQSKLAISLFDTSKDSIHLKVPLTNTTWGLDHNRPYTYQNAVLACHNLIEILELSYD